MKKLILLSVFASFFSSLAMEVKKTKKDIKGNKALNDLKNKLDEDSAESKNGIYRDRANKCELRDIEEKIVRSTSETEKVALINQKTQVLKNQSKIDQQLYKNGEYHFREKAATTEAQVKVIEAQETAKIEKERAQEKKERTVIKASEKKQGTIGAAREAGLANVEATRVKVNFIKENPKLILGLAAGISVGFFAAKHGTQILAQIIGHWYQTPTLAQETSLKSMKDRFLSIFSRNQSSVNDIDKVILEPKLAMRIECLANSVKNTIANEACFRNIMFYGLPGTGKTMLAKKIAKTSGLEYIYFAASSLDQFSIEEALIKLRQLFEYAKRSPQKLMIIIDEAEILFASRDHNLSEKTQKMLNLILTYTGTENSDYLVVALTNRPEDLDKAFLSRCGEKIEITPPNIEERKQILKQYINKFLISRAAVDASLAKFEQYRLGNRAKLVIGSQVFTDALILDLAEKTEGFVGRELMQFILSIQAAGYSSKNAVITSQLVKEILEFHIAQKEKESNGFKK